VQREPLLRDGRAQQVATQRREAIRA
jgi:hypothetical protein